MLSYIENGLTESTTVKVSQETVRKLAALQRSWQAKSIGETIEILLQRRKKDSLDAAFGSDPVKSRSFAENDRLEGNG